MPLNPSHSNSSRFEGCTLTGALSVTTSVRDSVSVVHGPAGCAHHNFSLLHTTGLDNDRLAIPRIVSSGMLDAEIVFGGEDALKQAIRAAVSEDASAVYVLSTCIAETIGDDVAAVCSGDWGVPVIPVPTAGFLGGSFQKGVNNALIAIARTVQPVECGTCVRRVNIIGEKNLEYEVEENYAEVERLLALLGISVNIRFIHNLAAEDIARLHSASLNILRDESLGPVGREIAQEQGMPSLSAFPAGLASTIRFLGMTAEACGTDPAPAVARERALQASLINDFRDIAGSHICPEQPFDGSYGEAVIREVAGILSMKVGPGGTRVPLPPAPPVGTAGVRRMLHRWRRALNA
jgi:nitrogenase molybdenum-iron protein alpha/beta subunit